MTAAEKTEAQKHIGTLYLLWMYITDKVGIRCHKPFYLSAGWSFGDFCSGECSGSSCLHWSSTLLISHIITLCVKFAQTIGHAKRVCVLQCSLSWSVLINGKNLMIWEMHNARQWMGQRRSGPKVDNCSLNFPHREVSTLGDGTVTASLAAFVTIIQYY